MASDTLSSPRSAALGTVLRGFGLVLIAVGAAGYLLPDGAVHWTALIPAGLGVAALLASLLRAAPMLAAGLGVAVAAMALLGGGSALPHLGSVLGGEASAAISSRAITALAAVLALAGIGWAMLRRDTARS
jgi:hypothetical protein